tara:strand:- start:4537 stop:4941 length:405 start_codon:yes stop_codon:yes gene_type:complete
MNNNMTNNIIENSIKEELIKKIEIPFESKIELYIVTEEDLYETENTQNVYKNMVGCFKSYEKAKRFYEWQKELDTDMDYQYEIRLLNLTKDHQGELFIPDRYIITPQYKDSVNTKNILKYLAKLQNIEKIGSDD